jgi:hypothetical protein
MRAQQHHVHSSNEASSISIFRRLSIDGFEVILFLTVFVCYTGTNNI